MFFQYIHVTDPTATIFSDKKIKMLQLDRVWYRWKKRSKWWSYRWKKAAIFGLETEM